MGREVHPDPPVSMDLEDPLGRRETMDFLDNKDFREKRDQL